VSDFYLHDASNARRLGQVMWPPVGCGMVFSLCETQALHMDPCHGEPSCRAPFSTSLEY
jgi:hypothetical protein